MRIFLTSLFTAAAFALAAAPVVAQEATDDDMDVVSDSEASAEQATGEISLPEDASEQGRESSAAGLETANEAREKRGEFGREMSEQARERGGQRASEAREGTASDRSGAGSDRP